jgi:hypothetical protein
VIGAAVGAFAGYRLDPDVKELAPSLAAVGLGVGGLLGFLLLAPVGVWHAWRRRARRRTAAPGRTDRSDDTGLWHTADPEGEAPPAAVEELPTVNAPAIEETEPKPPDDPSGVDEASAVTVQERPEQEREEGEDRPPDVPGPEVHEPPPGEEPGWYPDPRDGVRRYWDGHAWTGHVWRGRTSDRTRKTRGRR